MWTPPHSSQARKPPNFHFPMWATAFALPMIGHRALVPIDERRPARGRGPPGRPPRRSSVPRSGPSGCRPAPRPAPAYPCPPTWPPPCRRRRRPPGGPGSSGPDRRSRARRGRAARPATGPSGLALTPAAQKTLRTGMNSSPMETPCGVTLVTIEFRRTSTPMRSRSRWARALSSGGNGGSTRSAAFEEDDARRPRVDVLVVLREGLPGDLLDRAGEFDAGRARADDPERQRRAARRFVALVFGRLEGQEDAPPQLRGVLDALQARRDRGPLVVPEVGVRRPGRQDEVVVPNVAALPRSGAGRRRPRR